MVRRHIHCNATGSGELGQTALGSGCTAEILHAAEDLEHGREPGLAKAYSQAFMRPESEMCVRIHITVKADLFGLFESGRVLAGGNLSYIDISIFCPSFNQRGVRFTHQIAYYLFTLFNDDLLTIIFDGCLFRGFSR